MSLNSVVNSLVRAAAGIPSDISDTELDAHVAKLLAEEAKHREVKWGELGLGGLLGTEKDSPDPYAPKPNKRFLASVIKTVDGHNSALIQEQSRAAKVTREDRYGSDREVPHSRSSRSGGGPGPSSRLFGGAMRGLERKDRDGDRGKRHRGDDYNDDDDEYRRSRRRERDRDRDRDRSESKEREYRYPWDLKSREYRRGNGEGPSRSSKMYGYSDDEGRSSSRRRRRDEAEEQVDEEELLNAPEGSQSRRSSRKYEDGEDDRGSRSKRWYDDEYERRYREKRRERRRKEREEKAEREGDGPGSISGDEGRREKSNRQDTTAGDSEERGSSSKSNRQRDDEGRDGRRDRTTATSVAQKDSAVRSSRRRSSSESADNGRREHADSRGMGRNERNSANEVDGEHARKRYRAGSQTRDERNGSDRKESKRRNDATGDVQGEPGSISRRSRHQDEEGWGQDGQSRQRPATQTDVNGRARRSHSTDTPTKVLETAIEDVVPSRRGVSSEVAVESRGDRAASRTRPGEDSTCTDNVQQDGSSSSRSTSPPAPTSTKSLRQPAPALAPQSSSTSNNRTISSPPSSTSRSRPNAPPPPPPPPPSDLPPSPPPPSPPPASLSKMDRYFDNTYDPRLDLGEVPKEGMIAAVGWDNMLAVLKERGRKPRRSPSPPPALSSQPSRPSAKSLHIARSRTPSRSRSPSPTTLARRAARKARKAREARQAEIGPEAPASSAVDFESGPKLETEEDKERARRKEKKRKEREKLASYGKSQRVGAVVGKEGEEGYAYVPKGGIREWDLGK